MNSTNLYILITLNNILFLSVTIFVTTYLMYKEMYSTNRIFLRLAVLFFSGYYMLIHCQLIIAVILTVHILYAIAAVITHFLVRGR